MLYFSKKVEIGLYSAISIYLMGKMIDIVFEGINFTKMVYIISQKYEEISKKKLINNYKGEARGYMQKECIPIQIR